MVCRTQDHSSFPAVLISLKEARLLSPTTNIQNMKISSYAVKNYQFTLVIFIMIIVLGITTILNMPRSEDPEMHAPTYSVAIVYPGTSPKDMENLIVDPLEKEFSAQENIKRVRTNIGDGLAVIRIEY